MLLWCQSRYFKTVNIHVYKASLLLCQNFRSNCQKGIPKTYFVSNLTTPNQTDDTDICNQCIYIAIESTDLKISSPNSEANLNYLSLW